MPEQAETSVVSSSLSAVVGVVLLQRRGLITATIQAESTPGGCRNTVSGTASERPASSNERRRLPSEQLQLPSDMTTTTTTGTETKTTPNRPVVQVKPHTLILGTYPSITSLTDNRYCAHPLNAFWWIARDCLGFRRDTGISPCTGLAYKFTSSLRYVTSLWLRSEQVGVVVPAAAAAVVPLTLLGHSFSTAIEGGLLGGLAYTS